MQHKAFRLPDGSVVFACLFSAEEARHVHDAMAQMNGSTIAVKGLVGDPEDMSDADAHCFADAFTGHLAYNTMNRALYD